MLPQTLSTEAHLSIHGAQEPWEQSTSHFLLKSFSSLARPLISFRAALRHSVQPENPRASLKWVWPWTAILSSTDSSDQNHLGLQDPRSTSRNHPKTKLGELGKDEKKLNLHYRMSIKPGLTFH